MTSSGSATGLNPEAAAPAPAAGPILAPAAAAVAASAMAVGEDDDAGAGAELSSSIPSTSSSSSPPSPAPASSEGVLTPSTAEAYRAICESDSVAARIVEEIVRIVGLLRGDGSNVRRMRIADDFVDLLKGITTPNQAYMFVKKFASICRKITQRRRKSVRGASFTHFSGKPRKPVTIPKKHSTRRKRIITWNQPYVIGRLNGHQLH